MDLNLAALSPEEKDALLAQLIAAHEGGTPAPSAPEPSGGGGQDETTAAILKVLEILCSTVEALETQVKMLQGVVMDDIIGGIDSLYKSNQRGIGIEGLRGKYGKLFEPHGDALKELSPDEDVFDKLYDLIEAAKSGEGWNDEAEGKMAGDLAAGIADKIAKIRGTPAAAEAPAEEPAAVTVEKTEVSSAPEGADAELLKKVQAMKDKNKAKGL